MKQTICEACERAILCNSVARDEVMQQHLASCAQCQKFADFHGKLLTLKPIVPENMPRLSEIRQEMARRDAAVHRRNLRIVWPLSLAAACMAAVTGIFFHAAVGPESPPPDTAAPQAVHQTAAAAWTWGENEWADELAGETLQLAWDELDTFENSCKKSMAAARNGNGAWTVNTINSIEEELSL